MDVGSRTRSAKGSGAVSAAVGGQNGKKGRVLCNANAHIPLEKFLPFAELRTLKGAKLRRCCRTIEAPSQGLPYAANACSCELFEVGTSGSVVEPVVATGAPEEHAPRSVGEVFGRIRTSESNGISKELVGLSLGHLGPKLAGMGLKEVHETGLEIAACVFAVRGRLFGFRCINGAIREKEETLVPPEPIGKLPARFLGLNGVFPGVFSNLEGYALALKRYRPDFLAQSQSRGEVLGR